MKFYTYVKGVGSRIFHRYVENGEHHQEIVETFPINLFMPTKNDNDAIGLKGEKLKSISFDNIKDAKLFADTYKDVSDIHGQTSFVHQFITHSYPNKITFDINSIIIANIDIETAFGTSEFPDNHKITIRQQDKQRTLTLQDIKALSDFENIEVLDERTNEWCTFNASCYRLIGGFPKANLANQEILSISLKCFNDDIIYTWGLKPLQNTDIVNFVYMQCKSEKDLLCNFVDFWNKLKPNVLVGWNITGFDIPYLVNRMYKIIGDDRTRKLSPFHSHTKRVLDPITIQGDQPSYNILGIVIYDYMDLYKKYGLTKLEKYSLDHVSYVELNERKLDYSEYRNLMDLYHKDFDKYIQYNRHDVELVERIDKKLKFVFLALMLTYVAKVRHDEIFGQVKFWDILIYNFLHERNIQIPPQRRSGIDHKIEGGFVKEPVPGLYKWVITMDLTSLYPSNILQCNLSPDTLVSGATENLVDRMLNKSYNTTWLKEQDVCMTANGATFTRKTKGIMPQIVQTLFDERKSVKRNTLKTSREIELIKTELHNRGL